MEGYNSLYNYANFRKDVVSNIPVTIDLSSYNLNEDESELIIKGIPLVHDCIISIYDSVIEYSTTDYLNEKMMNLIENGEDVMGRNRASQAYLNTIFLSLLDIVKNGEYNFNQSTISVEKEYLKTLVFPLREKLKYKHDLTSHFSNFCDLEYLKNNEISDWKKCDTVLFIFDNPALCFTLRNMAQNRIQSLFFQYGDFRLINMKMWIFFRKVCVKKQSVN